MIDWSKENAQTQFITEKDRNLPFFSLHNKNSIDLISK